jgi:hypothetical protein
MRATLLAVPILLAVVTSASAQTGARFELGPVLRLDKVFIEGNASGSTMAAGAVATVKLSRIYGVEAEFTQASGRIARSYQGWFVSYTTDPNASREEIERMAPIARRSLGYEPGIGGSAAFTARGEINRRVALGVRLGVAARDYVETSAYTVLSIPAGVDPARVARDFQDSSSRRVRGGLLLGVDGSAALTNHLSVAPELRFVYGGPARIGDKHRELGVGVRGTWRF